MVSRVALDALQARALLLGQAADARERLQGPRGRRAWGGRVGERGRGRRRRGRHAQPGQRGRGRLVVRRVRPLPNGHQQVLEHFDRLVGPEHLAQAPELVAEVVRELCELRDLGHLDVADTLDALDPALKALDLTEQVRLVQAVTILDRVEQGLALPQGVVRLVPQLLDAVEDRVVYRRAVGIVDALLELLEGDLGRRLVPGRAGSTRQRRKKGRRAARREDAPKEAPRPPASTPSRAPCAPRAP